jgi:hypothetical protein
MGWLARALVCGALAVFYVTAAGTHASRVNWFKARGDQSGYLYDAKMVFANWHGQKPAALIGVRNRMPMYAGFLALFYRPSMSDDQFFQLGRRLNIYLSLALLAIVWLVASRYLPPLPAMNFTGVAAFGWFIFKAGYTQSELLYYTLFFLAFVAGVALFEAGTWRRTLAAALIGGAMCGLAHLTKAAVLPLVCIVLITGTAWAVGPLAGDRTEDLHGTPGGARGRALVRLASLALFALVFLAILWPYISTSRRVFGHYFYNVNSTFYVWYDNWPLASVGTALHGDGDHWPDMPESELPGPRRYWREHSVGQILDRLGGGFHDMGVVLRRDFDLLPYLALFAGTSTVLCLARPRETARILGDHAWSSILAVSCFGIYLLATAFYHPVSGTGTGRFLLALALPLFFVLARFISSSRFAVTSWRAGRVSFSVRHFHWLVSGVILFDVVFRVWARLMTTYGGF